MLGTATIVNGVATITVPSLPLGANPITASTPGDANNQSCYFACDDGDGGEDDSHGDADFVGEFVERQPVSYVYGDASCGRQWHGDLP